MTGQMRTAAPSLDGSFTGVRAATGPDTGSGGVVCVIRSAPAAQAGMPQRLMIDSTHLKTHGTAARPGRGCPALPAASRMEDRQPVTLLPCAVLTLKSAR